MKNYYGIVILFTALTFNPLFSQDKIYLSNQRIETGKILENSNNENVILEKADGGIIIVNKADIDRIVKNGNVSFDEDADMDDESYVPSGSSAANTGFYATNGQTAVVDKKDVSRKYNRNSVSFLFLTHDDKINEQVITNFQKVAIGNKYNLNPLPFDKVPGNFERDNGNNGTINKVQEIENYLNRKKAAKKIISYWFNRQKDGSMDMSLVCDRAMFNTNDNAFLQAMNTVRGASAIKDEGDRLIQNTYIIVFDLRNIHNSISKAGILTWEGDVDTYLFSVAFDEPIQNMVWKSWFGSADALTSAEKSEKKKAFNEIPFQVKHVLTTSAHVFPDASLMMLNAFNDALNANNNGIAYNGDGSAEFPGFMDRTFSAAMVSLENVRPDFIVKTGVYSTNPVTAKIGLKEGLKRNQMYEVLEMEQDTATKELIAHKVACIRATKVVNNLQVANGSSPVSKFTIIAQKQPIYEGMVIQQKNDKRMSVYTEFGTASGLKNFAIGLKNLNFIGTRGFSGSLLMDILLTSNEVVEKSYYEEDQIKSNFSGCLRIGYSFGFNLITPNLKLAPYAMFGIGFSSYNPEVTTTDQSTGETKSSFNEATYSYGSQLIYNISYPWQLYVKAEKFWIGSSSETKTCFGAGFYYNF